MSALLALTASLIWGTADFGGGILSRRLPTTAVVLYSQAIALLVLLLGLPFAHIPIGPYLAYGAVGGALGMVAIIAFYRAMAAGPMSLVAPITASGSVLPVAFGIAHGDRLSPPQFAGIACALIGVILASGPDLRGDNHARRTTVALSVVAAIGFGVFFPLVALGSATSVYGTLTVQRVVSVICLAPVLLRVGVREIPRPRADAWLFIAAVGVADVAANGAFAQATRTGALSVVSVLGSLYPVATIVLARYVLSERLRGVQTLGVLAALGGILLVNV
jgi:drug/metabolite transporter (DMT)-like permease